MLLIKRMPSLYQRYAWIVVAVTFLVLLFAAGVRTIPSVIIKPLEAEFGWDRGLISGAVAISLFAFGLGGPIAGSLVDRFGPRRVMLGGLALICVGLIPMANMTSPGELYLYWGLVVGVGTGAIANVLAATVANRWFNRHRGLVVGLLGASAAAGQLIFLPTMLAAVTDTGWRGMITIVAVAVGICIIPVFLFMRDKPQDLGLEPVGGSPQGTAGDLGPAFPMSKAIRTRDFWLLAGSFFICGYTTNGLIGTHLLTHTVEHGFVEVESAAALSLMGLMNIFGTLASGYFSDKIDNRKLLAMYYGFRALSLFALPFIIDMQGLFIFAVIYGLDWVATVPPTVNLTAKRFGRRSLGMIYGWIFCSHMIGAGIAAQAGGFFRDLLGDYHLIFISAGVLGFIAVALSMSIGRRRAPARPAAVSPTA
ncbi:MAG: MFS transporter [Pleurocapsa minor GSE-CHR-MK-17-07R]|jgi:sugar phosphate permease|nr:MFS transporter [Pleurocapsa minor GSE-CHR-MK 17-07R]